MQNQTKQTQILDALQTLLKTKHIQNISVSEIAQTAGIGKGSIYYYFPSKDSIVDALVERNYEAPLKTAKKLAMQTDISPFTRMALIFQACRNSSSAFRTRKDSELSDVREDAFIRQKYMRHLISEMKPVLTEIIRQNDIQSVTVVRMEVPCCGGIEHAVKTALQNSGKFIPWQVVTISTDGRILD